MEVQRFQYGGKKLLISDEHKILLEEADATLVLQHLADLWGYDVLMKEIDATSDEVLKEHTVSPRAGALG